MWTAKSRISTSFGGPPTTPPGAVAAAGAALAAYAPSPAPLAEEEAEAEEEVGGFGRAASTPVRGRHGSVPASPRSPGAGVRGSAGPRYTADGDAVAMGSPSE